MWAHRLGQTDLIMGFTDPAGQNFDLGGLLRMRTQKHRTSGDKTLSRVRGRNLCLEPVHDCDHKHCDNFQAKFTPVVIRVLGTVTAL